MRTKNAMTGKAWIAVGMALGPLALIAAPPARGASTAVTVQALRMAGRITCGLMPASDPAFQAMVSKLSGSPPDYMGAAAAAVASPYFAQCLVRRMAKEMMTPSMSAGGVPDNDATTFIVATLTGIPGQTPGISKLWSDDATYLIKVAGASCAAFGDANCSTGGSAPSGVPGSTGPYCHALDLGPAQLAAVSWQTDLVRVPNLQCATNLQASKFGTSPVIEYVPIPASDTAGYLTLSDRPNDGSYAVYGFEAGTNLRGIEGMYEIATGYDIPSMETDLPPPLTSLEGDAPAFVPAGNLNFANAVTQTACLACHGGGVSNTRHGYSALADLFDYPNAAKTNIGFYPSLPPVTVRKSNGSNASIRGLVAACTTANYLTNNCNPYSGGVDDVGLSWDLSDWSPVASGAWGWTGPTSGHGWNALGAALGKSGIVYTYMVQRVVSEICPPSSSLPPQTISQIAAQAMKNDSFAYIVEAVASNPGCL